VRVVLEAVVLEAVVLVRELKAGRLQVERPGPEVPVPLVVEPPLAVRELKAGRLQAERPGPEGLVLPVALARRHPLVQGRNPQSRQVEAVGRHKMRGKHRLVRGTYPGVCRRGKTCRRSKNYAQNGLARRQVSMPVGRTVPGTTGMGFVTEHRARQSS
jgi:hypothetical protein